ncbi:MAG: hypothetical protein ABIR25_06825 [Sphingomicrobium sp.]
MRMPAVVPIILRHWFLLLLPVLASASVSLVASVDWQHDGRVAELALLFDACVSLPLLYFLCYRGTLDSKQMALRLIGLACLGIWFATWLVPETSQSLLSRLGWLRTAGVALLVVVELRLIVGAIKMAFSGKASADQLASASGAPPWIAKLMLLEARFWRWVWRRISGR